MLEPGRSEPVGADADILHKMGPAVKGAGPPVTRDDKRGSFPRLLVLQIRLGFTSLDFEYFHVPSICNT